MSHQALYDQLRTEAPVVRGDWFLATATKAPLYDLLVDTPPTLDQLAARLGVDINDDINHPGLAEPDNLVRIGFRRSGVALHNRMLERHLGNAGPVAVDQLRLRQQPGPAGPDGQPAGARPTGTSRTSCTPSSTPAAR